MKMSFLHTLLVVFLLWGVRPGHSAEQPQRALDIATDGPTATSEDDWALPTSSYMDDSGPTSHEDNGPAKHVYERPGSVVPPLHAEEQGQDITATPLYASMTAPEPLPPQGHQLDLRSLVNMLGGGGGGAPQIFINGVPINLEDPHGGFAMAGGLGFKIIIGGGNLPSALELGPAPTTSEMEDARSEYLRSASPPEEGADAQGAPPATPQPAKQTAAETKREYERYMLEERTRYSERTAAARSNPVTAPAAATDAHVLRCQHEGPKVLRLAYLAMGHSVGGVVPSNAAAQRVMVVAALERRLDAFRASCEDHMQAHVHAMASAVKKAFRGGSAEVEAPQNPALCDHLFRLESDPAGGPAGLAASAVLEGRVSASVLAAPVLLGLASEQAWRAFLLGEHFLMCSQWRGPHTGRLSAPHEDFLCDVVGEARFAAATAAIDDPTVGPALSYINLVLAAAGSSGGLPAAWPLRPSVRALAALGRLADATAAHAGAAASDRAGHLGALLSVAGQSCRDVVRHAATAFAYSRSRIGQWPDGDTTKDGQDHTGLAFGVPAHTLRYLHAEDMETWNTAASRFMGHHVLSFWEEQASGAARHAAPWVREVALPAWQYAGRDMPAVGSSTAVAALTAACRFADCSLVAAAHSLSKGQPLTLRTNYIDSLAPAVFHTGPFGLALAAAVVDGGYVREDHLLPWVEAGVRKTLAARTSGGEGLHSSHSTPSDDSATTEDELHHGGDTGEALDDGDAADAPPPPPEAPPVGSFLAGPVHGRQPVAAFVRRTSLADEFHVQYALFAAGTASHVSDATIDDHIVFDIESESFVWTGFHADDSFEDSVAAVSDEAAAVLAEASRQPLHVFPSEEGYPLEGRRAAAIPPDAPRIALLIASGLLEGVPADPDHAACLAAAHLTAHGYEDDQRSVLARISVRSGDRTTHTVTYIQKALAGAGEAGGTPGMQRFHDRLAAAAFGDDFPHADLGLHCVLRDAVRYAVAEEVAEERTQHAQNASSRPLPLFTPEQWVLPEKHGWLDYEEISSMADAMAAIADVSMALGGTLPQPTGRMALPAARALYYSVLCMSLQALAVERHAGMDAGAAEEDAPVVVGACPTLLARILLDDSTYPNALFADLYDSGGESEHEGEDSQPSLQNADEEVAHAAVMDRDVFVHVPMWGLCMRRAAGFHTATIEGGGDALLVADCRRLVAEHLLALATVAAPRDTLLPGPASAMRTLGLLFARHDDDGAETVRTAAVLAEASREFDLQHAAPDASAPSISERLLLRGGADAINSTLHANISYFHAIMRPLFLWQAVDAPSLASEDEAPDNDQHDIDSPALNVSHHTRPLALRGPSPLRLKGSAMRTDLHALAISLLQEGSPQWAAAMAVRSTARAGYSAGSLRRAEEAETECVAPSASHRELPSAPAPFTSGGAGSPAATAALHWVTIPNGLRTLALLADMQLITSQEAPVKASDASVFRAAISVVFCLDECLLVPIRVGLAVLRGVVLWLRLAVSRAFGSDGEGAEDPLGTGDASLLEAAAVLFHWRNIVPGALLRLFGAASDPADDEPYHFDDSCDARDQHRAMMALRHGGAPAALEPIMVLWGRAAGAELGFWGQGGWLVSLLAALRDTVVVAVLPDPLCQLNHKIPGVGDVRGAAAVQRYHHVPFAQRLAANQLLAALGIQSPAHEAVGVAAAPVAPAEVWRSPVHAPVTSDDAIHGGGLLSPQSLASRPPVSSPCLTVSEGGAVVSRCGAAGAGVRWGRFLYTVGRLLATVVLSPQTPWGALLRGLAVWHSPAPAAAGSAAYPLLLVSGGPSSAPSQTHVQGREHIGMGAAIFGPELADTAVFSSVPAMTAREVALHERAGLPVPAERLGIGEYIARRYWPANAVPEPTTAPSATVSHTALVGDVRHMFPDAAAGVFAEQHLSALLRWEATGHAMLSPGPAALQLLRQVTATSPTPHHDDDDLSATAITAMEQDLQRYALQHDLAVPAPALVAHQTASQRLFAAQCRLSGGGAAVAAMSLSAPSREPLLRMLYDPLRAHTDPNASAFVRLREAWLCSGLGTTVPFAAAPETILSDSGSVTSVRLVGLLPAVRVLHSVLRCGTAVCGGEERPRSPLREAAFLLGRPECVVGVAARIATLQDDEDITFQRHSAARQGVDGRVTAVPTLVLPAAIVAADPKHDASTSGGARTALVGLLADIAAMMARHAERFEGTATYGHDDDDEPFSGASLLRQALRDGPRPAAWLPPVHPTFLDVAAGANGTDPLVLHFTRRGAVLPPVSAEIATASDDLVGATFEARMATEASDAGHIPNLVSDTGAFHSGARPTAPDWPPRIGRGRSWWRYDGLFRKGGGGPAVTAATIAQWALVPYLEWLPESLRLIVV